MRTYRVNVESREYYEINHDAVLRSHALIHTELTEALDDIDGERLEMTFREEDDKPEGLGVELGDVVLRVCDTMQALGLAFAEDALTIPGPPTCYLPRPQSQHMHQLIDAARRNVDKATEAARVDAWVSYVNRLGKVLAYVVAVAVAYSIDLQVAIEAKMAYNATRPTRHGGKRA